MTMEEKTFGTWLRGERRRLDLSRQVLANRAGCAEITLRRIESGTLKPSRELAQILLEQVGMREPELNRWVLYARGLSGYPIQPDGPTPAKVESNLPVFLTTFIGRAKEKKEIIDLIHRQRLITLTGPGGVGKTRLAGKVGEQILGEFSNGVWMAELASQATPELLPQTVAAVFDITTQSKISYLELLVNFLRPRKILLILDNCEHLPQACAQLAEALLKACPDLKILATSREALKVMGEAVYHVPSLGIPDEQATLEKYRQFESIQLFDERASLAQSDFGLTMENIPYVVQVCRRLDGIPLAIELAAARVDIFSIEQIAAQLGASFDLLTNGSRTALPRQQTMRGSIEWSWELLSDAERTLLRRLSVFAGGWSVEEAEAVCGGNGIESPQVANLMTSLAAKSLVSVNQAVGKERRYSLHEMIRQFAQDKMEMEETENTCRLHLSYFLKFSEQAETALHGPDQLDWLTRISEEQDNLRAALNWASRTDTEAGLLIIGRLSGDLDLCEGLDWVTEFIGKPESHKYPQARAKARLAHANYLWELQQFDNARAAVEESLALFRGCSDREGEFGCLMTLGSIAQFVESMDRKVEYHGQALALARSLGDTQRQAQALSGLGWDRRDADRSTKYWEESVALYRLAGDWRVLAFLLGIFGDTLLANGETKKAQVLLKESLELNLRLKSKSGMEFVLVARSRQDLMNGDFAQARAALHEWIGLAEELGNRMGLLYARTRLGYVALCEGSLEEGYQILCETAFQFQKDGSQNGLAFTMEKLAHYFVLTTMHERAVRLIGWADAVRERTGEIRPRIEQADVEVDFAMCIASLGKVGYTNAYNHGRGMTPEEAVALALEEKGD